MQPTSFVGLCISTGGITAPLAKIGDIGRLPFLLYTLAEDQKFFGISPYRRNITGSLPFPVCRTSLLRKHAQHIWRDINEAVARNLSNGLVVYPFSANASAKKLMPVTPLLGKWYGQSKDFRNSLSSRLLPARLHTNRSETSGTRKKFYAVWGGEQERVNSAYMAGISLPKQIFDP